MRILCDFQNKKTFSVFTKPVKVPWPLTDASKDKTSAEKIREKLSENAPKNGTIEVKDTEAELLSLFLAKYTKFDPDLIVGHDIFGFDIGTLIHRLVVNKISFPSRIGRLRLSNLSSVGKVSSTNPPVRLIVVNAVLILCKLFLG